MTTTLENGKVLMYRGRVDDLFLDKEGKISYITLKNCARFYMIFGESGLSTSAQYDLFSSAEKPRRWEYLFIEGKDIANVLFDPSAETIRATPEGTAALKKALSQMRQSPRPTIRRSSHQRSLQQGPPLGG
jgi:hypothetical protein